MHDLFDPMMWGLLGQNAPPAPRGITGLLLGPYLPFLAIGVLFYFLMIRPERRKRAELKEMLSNLKRKDQVVTIGGIFGTVVNVREDSDEVTISVDDNSNTKLRMQRSAIARVIDGRQNSGS